MTDSDALFVYGTLRDDRIQQALLGRVVHGEPAMLSGWAVHCSEDGFLFIKPAAAGQVPGLVLRLSPTELQIVDAWEDVPLYIRERVLVSCPAGEREVWTYTRRDGEGPLHADDSNSAHDREQVIKWALELRAELEADRGPS